MDAREDVAACAVGNDRVAFDLLRAPRGADVEIPRRRVAATPRLWRRVAPRLGSSAETSRAATWIIPRSRAARRAAVETLATARVCERPSAASCSLTVIVSNGSATASKPRLRAAASKAASFSKNRFRRRLKRHAVRGSPAFRAAGAARPAAARSAPATPPFTGGAFGTAARHAHVRGGSVDASRKQLSPSAPSQASKTRAGPRPSAKMT